MSEGEAREYKRGMDFALRSLARKEQPSFVIRKKLFDREIDKGTVEKIIAQCIAWNFINDERWLEGYIRQQKEKNKGPGRIFPELLRLGVDKELAQHEIARLLPEEERSEGIKRLLDTKYKKLDLRDQKQRQKVIMALLRRGYRWDEIKDAVQSRRVL